LTGDRAAACRTLAGVGEQIAEHFQQVLRFPAKRPV
jgi:hypothetical protein